MTASTQQTQKGTDITVSVPDLIFKGVPKILYYDNGVVYETLPNDTIHIQCAKLAELLEYSDDITIGTCVCDANLNVLDSYKVYQKDPGTVFVRNKGLEVVPNVGSFWPYKKVLT